MFLTRLCEFHSKPNKLKTFKDGSVGNKTRDLLVIRYTDHSVNETHELK